jgi:type I restriction enzyme S subunit
MIDKQKTNCPIKKIEEVCDFQNGLWTGKKPPFFVVKVIRNTNFKNNDGTLNYDSVAEIEVEKKQLESRLLQKGDIILERSGGGPDQPVGRVAYFDNDDEFSFSNFTTRIRSIKNIDSKYLWLFLNFFYKSGKTEVMQKKTTGIRNLIFSEYKNIEIPLPPLPEQKKIVARLEKLLAKVKEAKRLRVEALELTQNLLSAELHKIFAEGKKKKWEEKNVEEISDDVQYGFTASARERGNAQMLRITDIQNGTVNWAMVPFCKCEELERYKLFNGDIVFARTGATVGKSYLINNPPENAVFASYLIRVKTNNKKCSPELLYYFFQSPCYWDQVTKQQVGGAQPNVNGSKLKKIKISVPSFHEQKKIVARLDALQEKVKKLLEHQKSTLADLDRLEQSILHCAFRGGAIVRCKNLPKTDYDDTISL